MRIPRASGLLAILFLSSCGLFHNVPPEVVEGQRQAYAGVQNLEENYEAMITELETQQKLLITYIHNFAFQVQLTAFEEDHPIEGSVWNETEEEKAAREEQDRENQIAVEQKRVELETKRDADIARDHDKVVARMTKWRDIGARGHDSVKKLLGAVYDNISTSPISVDNIATIIGKSQQLWNKIDEEINQ